MTLRATSAQTNRSCMVVVSSEESRRVQRYIDHVGRGVEGAAKRLRIGVTTLDAARDHGSMMRATRDRLFAALDREEMVAS